MSFFGCTVTCPITDADVAKDRFPENPILAANRVRLEDIFSFDNATSASQEEEETQRSWTSSNASINSLQMPGEPL